MQTVPCYHLLKLWVPTSGLGGGKTGPSAHSYQGTISFLHTVLVLVFGKGSKGNSVESTFRGTQPYYVYRAMAYFVYPEQGHGKGNMLETGGDQKHDESQ